MTWKYVGNTNKDQRTNFATKYNSTFLSFGKSDSLKGAIKRLKELSPVEDNSKVNPKSPISLNDENSLTEILEISYRVRSNLDHGSKDLERADSIGSRNRDLVEFAFKATFEILEWALISDRII